MINIELIDNSLGIQAKVVTEEYDFVHLFFKEQNESISEYKQRVEKEFKEDVTALFEPVAKSGVKGWRAYWEFQEEKFRYK